MKILLTLLSIILLSSMSCKKESLTKESDRVYITHEIPVYEQENVDYYDVEVLHNDKWILIDNFFANTFQEFTYVIDVDITKYYIVGKTTYTRIKAVDVDGKITYSQVLGTQL